MNRSRSSARIGRALTVVALGQLQVDHTRVLAAPRGPVNQAPESPKPIDSEFHWRLSAAAGDRGATASSSLRINQT